MPDPDITRMLRRIRTARNAAFDAALAMPVGSKKRQYRAGIVEGLDFASHVVSRRGYLTKKDARNARR